MTSMEKDTQQWILAQILDKSIFIRAVFSRFEQAQSPGLIRVVVRPVQIKKGYHWQVSTFDERQDVSRNYRGEEAEKMIRQLLDLPYRNLLVETTAGTLQARRTKKGKLLISQSKQPSSGRTPELTHDHEKERLLPTSQAIPFLQAVGIAAHDGRIKAAMQKKYHQVNQFLRLVDETGAFKDFKGGKIQVVDFGCGKAYLTFGLHFYLRHILDLEAAVVGVDLRQELLAANRERARELGWEGLSFQTGSIADFQPETTPDMVVALHACDTATDDALAQGIRWGSRLILTAPCCQHDLQEKLSRQPLPPPFQALSRQGLLQERLGDILTDTFRAAILRVAGYRTDVIEFISTEHTRKNLMLRAVKTAPLGNEQLREEYRALREYWQVTPYLEQKLAGELSL